MTLGQRIQEYRKQQGLSQESLGDALGVSRQAVSKWEGDNGIPELDTLVAMSRLFGITVGQLLGVEETFHQEEEHSDRIDEDRLEAILRQYTAEASTHRQNEPWITRWGWAVSAAIIATTVIIVLFVQNNSLRSTVKLLQRDVSNLQVQVSNNQSNLVGTIRNTIYDVLAEEARLYHQFEWHLIDFDLENQTATVQLKATLKEYTAGSKLQFTASWRKVDDTEGTTNSDWVEGPDFTASVTLPLNYHTDIGVRVESADGTIKEQAVDSISELHPENFNLFAGDLMAPFAITTRSFGVTYTTSKAEQEFINIFSVFPRFICPEKAVLTAYVNDEEVFSEEMTITPHPSEKGQHLASIENYYFDLTLQEGDSLKVVLLVTDNLGRTEELVEGGTVKDGRLERGGVTAPVITVD